MTDNDKMREEFGKWLVQRRLGRFADFNGNLIDCTAVFWEAWQTAKSVPVVGESVQDAMVAALVDWVRAAPHGDNCFLHNDGGEFDNCFCGKDSLLAAFDDAEIERLRNADLTPTSVSQLFQPGEHGQTWVPVDQAELERLRKDAERYRWLSYNASYSIHEMLFGKPAFITTHKESDLAESIDAAIAGEKK